MKNHEFDGKCPACEEVATKADMVALAIAILLAVCFGLLLTKYF